MVISVNPERRAELWASDNIIHNGFGRIFVSVKFENLLPRQRQNTHRTQMGGRYPRNLVELAVQSSKIKGGLKRANMLRGHHVFDRGSWREMPCFHG
ncbi:MAG: hypothetical protein WCS42_14860, partial [Verrucomicrobiota bacterium]